ncbi:hypothetical protein [Accumulibacter sp.]|uniref:hypothetical protein n=1 Tax=Accumulibacter sp. TaxID=2053492 RepID=UPI0025E25B7A|nr:hypothetical protein [Accumulibacter sp.]
MKMVQEQDPDLDNGDAENEEQETEANGADDVALRPGPNADAEADVERYISADVRALYDVYSYRHAAAILANSFPDELVQIEAALLAFRITTGTLARQAETNRLCRRSFLTSCGRPGGSRPEFREI